MSRYKDKGIRWFIPRTLAPCFLAGCGNSLALGLPAWGWNGHTAACFDCCFSRTQEVFDLFGQPLGLPVVGSLGSVVWGRPS